MVDRKNINDEKITSKQGLAAWFNYFGQDQAHVSWPERFRSAVGALIGLLCTVIVGRMLGEFVGVNEWIMASLGASALLIFVMPSSPMAQPWAVIGGNGVSALVGITCNHFISDPVIALPLAASCAIMAMFLLRCLHPPAAAVALIAVLGHVSSYQYAVFPVIIDSIILCLVAMIYNTVTGKRYPTKPAQPTFSSPKEKLSREEAEKALDASLDEYQELMNVDREELIRIIQLSKSLKKA